MATHALSTPAKAPGWLGLVALVGLCLAVGAVGGLATSESVRTWYPTLVKPSFNPPAWIFGPVWTVLYVLMAVSAWLAWRAGGVRPLVPWAVQLLLNALWSPIFFGAHLPGVALVVIVGLWCAIVWTAVGFHRHSRPAAWLLAPYLAWVTFATVLNASIVALN